MARADALTRGNLHEQLEEVFSKLPLGPRSAIFMTVDCAERGFGDRCHLRAAPPFASPHRHNPLLCASAHASCSYRPFVTRALVLACAELWHWSTCAFCVGQLRSLFQLRLLALQTVATLHLNAQPVNPSPHAPHPATYTQAPKPSSYATGNTKCPSSSELTIHSLSPPPSPVDACACVPRVHVYICACVFLSTCVCVFRPARSCLHM